MVAELTSHRNFRSTGDENLFDLWDALRASVKGEALELEPAPGLWIIALTELLA